MPQLQREHEARQLQRMKTRAPIMMIGTLIAIGSVGAAILLWSAGRMPAAVATGTGGLVLGALWSLSVHLLAEWDRALILRFGRFHSVKGPGFFAVIPIADSVVRVVDMRVRTTDFYCESMLTRDTVPVDIDAIAFWHVWDTQKAVLELESYYQAIALAVQTALRDIVGVNTLAEVLAEREKMAETLQKVIADKTQAWGITVASIELRDISIPDNLRDALSKQAQAEREKQSRTILGDAEVEIAQKFAQAARAYAGNPVALQLRAMNILYEGLRAGGSMILVPSTVLDTMNLGGLVALGTQAQSQSPPGGDVGPERPRPPAQPPA